jgi:hypothetical protein
MADTYPGGKGVIDTDNGAMVYQSPGTKIVSIQENDPLAWQKIKDSRDYFSKDPEVKTLVVDSATTTLSAGMEFILRMGNRMGQPPQLQDYGRLRTLSKEFVFQTFASNKNCIFIFHEQMEKDELTGRVWCNPMVIGKLAAEIPMHFDEVYHLEPNQGVGGKVEYRVLTKSTTMYCCKSRLDSILPGGIDVYMPADFAQFLSRVRSLAMKGVE